MFNIVLLLLTRLGSKINMLLILTILYTNYCIAGNFGEHYYLVMD